MILASGLAGVASTGAPGIAALSMITIILGPLGLPVEVAIILLVAIDPIVDPDPDRGQRARQRRGDHRPRAACGARLALAKPRAARP